MTPTDAMTWFLILNVFDILITMYVLNHGGRELNPRLVKWFQRDDPDVVLIRVKVVLLSFVWLSAYFGALPSWALWALVIGYLALAGHNINTAMKVWKRTHP